MTQEELREVLLNFPASESRIDEVNKIEIFEVNFEKLLNLAHQNLKNDELGNFDRETFEKNIKRAENSDKKKAIFAIIHNGSQPLQFELNTGTVLANILRQKESVVPSKLLNPKEWSKVIGFGQISSEEAEDLVRLSFRNITE